MATPLTKYINIIFFFVKGPNESLAVWPGPRDSFFKMLLMSFFSPDLLLSLCNSPY